MKQDKKEERQKTVGLILEIHAEHFVHGIEKWNYFIVKYVPTFLFYEILQQLLLLMNVNWEWVSYKE